jgi:hypothetical protein
MKSRTATDTDTQSTLLSQNKRGKAVILAQIRQKRANMLDN